MLPGPESGKVGVVGRGRVGDGPLAPRVQVAQVESELLKRVVAQVVVIPEDVVGRRFRSSLEQTRAIEIY